ncbi:MAG: OprO/OprP family phosphate-selective porin [bacterium]
MSLMKQINLCLLSIFAFSSSGFAAQVGGRIEMDSVSYLSNTAQKNKHSKVRRLRLGIYQPISKKWSFYLQTDFKNKKSDPQGMWLQYKVNRKLAFKLGRQEIPFSLDSVSSSRFNLFMERSIASVLSERYGFGLGTSYRGKGWNLWAGLFGEDQIHLGGKSQYGKSWAGRATFYRKNSNLIHFGVSAMIRRPDQRIRFRAATETGISKFRFLNTGYRDDVTAVNRLGSELLVSTGKTWLQAEWLNTHLQTIYSPTATFNGAYISMGHLFNAKRIFNTRKSKWAGIENDGIAWEIGARISYLDLSDGEIQAGRQSDLTLGVNLYLNSETRLMFNWVRAFAIPDSASQNNQLNVIEARLQTGF